MHVFRMIMVVLGIVFSATILWLFMVFQVEYF